MSIPIIGSEGFLAQSAGPSPVGARIANVRAGIRAERLRGLAEQEAQTVLPTFLK
jgi:hypothetical protein